MIILAIETSCDDTGVSILRDEKVISQVLSSQTSKHNKYGGIIPELASRLHSKNIDSVISRAIKIAKISIYDINYISYTQGPGLINTLQVGMIAAKTMSQFLKIPLVPINHIEAHLYSPYIGKKLPSDKFKKPRIGVVVSGGHTHIFEMNNFKYKIIAATLDDTIGEAYDKVGKMLGYKYPGGPTIDKKYDEKKANVKLKTSKLENGKLSYSGLKSQVRKVIESNNYTKIEIGSSFQRTAVEQIIWNIKKIDLQNYKEGILAGGVSSNSLIRNEIKKLPLDFILPEKNYCKDNASMIGYLAYLKIKLEIEEQSDYKEDTFSRISWK